LKNIILIIDDSEIKRDYLITNIKKYLTEYQEDEEQIKIVWVDNLRDAMLYCINNKNNVLCIFLDLCFYSYKDHTQISPLAGYRFLMNIKTDQFSFLKDIPTIISSSEEVDLSVYKDFENVIDYIVVNTSLSIYTDIENILNKLYITPIDNIINRMANVLKDRTEDEIDVAIKDALAKTRENNKTDNKKTSISGLFNDYTKIYNELKQWDIIPSEGLDSKVKGVLYGVGYSMCELPYYVPDKERMHNERMIYNKVHDAYSNLLHTLEDAIGIESKEEDK
jgi:hypothetical protein